MTSLSFSLIVLLLACSGFLAVDSKGHVGLTVKSDSPAVVGGNITFSACLENHFDSENYTFSFTFSDGIQEIVVKEEGTNASLSVEFVPAKYKTGFYNMSVSVRKVEQTSVESEKILAYNYTTFQLTEYLVGKVIAVQGNRYDIEEIATKQNVTFSLNLHDNLENAEVDYMWTVDFQQQPYFENNLTYSYNRPGPSILMASVAAQLENGVVVFGYFKKNLTVKVPVNNINYSGNPFIPHEKMLDLNITCNGSSPFAYCYEYLEAGASLNFTCIQPIETTKCNFYIQRYFQSCGIYNVGIYVSNDVGVERKIIEVRVYSVSKKPQLSTVIIPIVCSLLTLIIIAGGIAYCVQQRNQLAIEVANFDFQDESEPYVGRTFFEQVFDSFTCQVCNLRRTMSSGDSDTYSETTEALLTSESRKSYSL